MFRNVVVSLKKLRFPWEIPLGRETHTFQPISPCPPNAPRPIPITKVCVLEKPKVCPPPPSKPMPKKGSFLKTVLKAGIIYIVAKYMDFLGFWGTTEESMCLYDNIYRSWVSAFGDPSTLPAESIEPPRLDIMYYNMAQKWNRLIWSSFSALAAFDKAFDKKPEDECKKSTLIRECPHCTCDKKRPEKQSQEGAGTGKETEGEEMSSQENKKTKHGCYECP